MNIVDTGLVSGN